MTRQTFDTIDHLRLEVGKPPSTGPRNLLRNVVGRIGAWGWLTPIAGCALSSIGGQSAHTWTGEFEFEFTTATIGSGVATHFTSEPQAVSPGKYVKGQIRHKSFGPATSGGLSVVFLDANRAPVSATASVAIANGVADSTITTATALVPATARFAAVRVDVNGSTTISRRMRFTRAMLAYGDTSATVSAYAYAEPYTYTDILGPTYDLTVDRGALSLGILTARIADSSLDPSASDLIRPGNPVRLLAHDPIPNEWQPIFTGEILNGNVAYDYLRRDASKQADITLTATDATKTLANIKQTQGVGTINDLVYVLEGCGVPWVVNSSSGQLGGTPTIVSTNESASVLDQIAMTRDSELGYAWVSRYGAMNARATGMPTYNRATLTPSVYNSDISIDYDTERCINTVTIKLLKFDVDGRTVETVLGPYTDEQSIARWGARAQEFTMQGITAATAAARAASILAANATPRVGVKSLTVPIKHTADLVSGAHTSAVERRAHLDIYDRVRVTNNRANLDQTLRITTIKHRITPTKWLVDLEFANTSGVAMPSEAPELTGTRTFPDTSWTGVTFLNGWVNYDASTWRPVEYRRSGGEVILRGMCKSGPIGQPVFTLPPGFRPNRNEIFSVAGFNGSAETTGLLYVQASTGNVYTTTPGLNGYLSMSRVSFDAEQ